MSAVDDAISSATGKITGAARDGFEKVADLYQAELEAEAAALDKAMASNSSLVSELAAARAENAALAKSFAEYKTKNPETPPPPVVTPPTPPTSLYQLVAPKGYSNVLYNRDFTKPDATDDAKWQIRTGKAGNHAGLMQASQVVKSGPNGQVLIAAQSSSTATLVTGAVYNYDIPTPQHYYASGWFSFPGFQEGAWPSWWQRPHPSFKGAVAPGEGEIDHFEGFSSHLDWLTGKLKSGFARIWGSTIILTPYGSQKNITAPLDSGFPRSSWDQPHFFEWYKKPGVFESWIDGKLVATVKRPTDATNAAKWDAQMEDLTKKWYWRADMQTGIFDASHDEAGDPQAWPFRAEQRCYAFMVATV